MSLTTDQMTNRQIITNTALGAYLITQLTVYTVV